MDVFFLILSISLLLFGAIWFISGLVDGDGGDIGIGGLAFFMGVILLSGLISTDATRAIDKNNVKSQIGIVTDISSSQITIDNDDIYKLNIKVEKAYDTKLGKISLGDTVKIEYVSTSLNEYITKINTVTVTEIVYKE